MPRIRIGFRHGATLLLPLLLGAAPLHADDVQTHMDNVKTVADDGSESLAETAREAYEPEDGAPAENWFGNLPAAGEEPNPMKGGSDADSVPEQGN